MIPITEKDTLDLTVHRGGPWLHATGDDVIESRSPADPHRVVALVPTSLPHDVDAAIEAAQRGFGDWAAQSPVARGRTLMQAATILRDRVEEVARLLTLEEGKPIAEARAEVLNAANVLEYYGAFGTRLTGETLPSARSGVSLSTVREPLGVLALITPWNFPVNLPAVKLGPSLVAGNAVIMKPATEAAATTLELIAILHEAGVPAGAINAVVGSGGEIGAQLVRARRLAAVSFTGSTAVGRDIARVTAAVGTRCLCEMGGKNALVVLRDADLDHATGLAVEGGFRSAGQKCTATSRVIVERPVADRFRERLLARIADLRVGDPMDEAVFVGPLVSESRLDAVLDYIAIGRDEGASLVHGGSRAGWDGLERGYYVEPTLFDRVTPDMRIAREEIFGPVAVLMEARDFDHAIELANATDYGLTASICTSDLHLANRFVREVATGTVGVNLPTAGQEFHAPFGGIKASGTAHKEQGSAAIDFYTHLKTIAVDHAPAAG